MPVSPRAAPDAAPANPGTQNVPILDIEQLEDLRYLPSSSGEAPGDDDPVGGLIRLFQAKAVERLQLMEGMLARGDWHDLSEMAHSLRGASASMGFPRVAALCKDLENSARTLTVVDGTSTSSTTGADLAGLLEQIKRHYAEAEHALAEWLAATPATAGK
jgi:HPt (histidine-containing phosphotransfer) domain-containing protein